MIRTRIVLKLVALLSLGSSVMAGGCITENLWADILANSIITGGVEALRNTLLVAANLQTP